MNAVEAAKRVWSAVRRLYPRCGMISQAVAFNMFLAFFPMLLVVLGILSSYVNTRAALPDVVEGLYAVLPPGSRQMMTAFLLARAAHPWHWALLGCSGTLLAGSQVMKLLMEGSRLFMPTRTSTRFWEDSSGDSCCCWRRWRRFWWWCCSRCLDCRCENGRCGNSGGPGWPTDLRA